MVKADIGKAPLDGVSVHFAYEAQVNNQSSKTVTYLLIGSNITLIVVRNNTSVLSYVVSSHVSNQVGVLIGLDDVTASCRLRDGGHC